jgi:phage I-like protein
VEWTEKARKYLANGEYRYFSPVFYARKGDRKVMKILAKDI